MTYQAADHEQGDDCHHLALEPHAGHDQHSVFLLRLTEDLADGGDLSHPVEDVLWLHGVTSPSECGEPGHDHPPPGGRGTIRLPREARGPWARAALGTIAQERSPSWSRAPHWKCGIRGQLVSRVRIPLAPPNPLYGALRSPPTPATP